MQTLSQICLLACYNAKAGSNMTAIAGQKLNLVLEDLTLNRDLKINRVTQILTVTAGTYGPFALEADYLRTYDMSYPLQGPNGMTQFLVPITMEQWDAEFKGGPNANYPYEFATDLSSEAQVWSGASQGVGTLTSAGNVYIFPQSNGTINITHRYMRWQPDYVNPQSSNNFAWFPYSGYLEKATTVKMMEITGDDRHDAYEKQCEEMLRPHLIQEGDEQQTVRAIRLDPRHFKNTQALRPTKVNPF
jgi:hypothetical protein